MKSFGTLLKSYRQEKKLTQTELANSCNFSRNYITYLECERKIAPPDKSVSLLAEALSLSPEDTQILLESAQSERLSHTFCETNKLEVESLLSYAAANFSKDEVFRLSKRLQKLALSK